MAAISPGSGRVGWLLFKSVRAGQRICVFLYAIIAALSVAAEDVHHLTTDAEQLEKRGETDSAIAVLKDADKLDPENIQVAKLLARAHKRSFRKSPPTFLLPRLRIRFFGSLW
jgi:hypothetical protein